MTQLPSVQLGTARIPLEILKVVPLEVAERYWVLPFALSDERVRLALVYPEQLKPDFAEALDRLANQVGRSVELFKTDRTSFMRVLAQYRAELMVGVEPSAGHDVARLSGEVPTAPHYTVGQDIARAFLDRIPAEYAALQRVICVDGLPPATYWFASDAPKRAPRLLQEIARQNSITAYLVPVEGPEFERLLSMYTTLPEEIKAPEIPQPEEVAPQLPVGVSAEVQVPQAPAETSAEAAAPPPPQIDPVAASEGGEVALGGAPTAPPPSDVVAPDAQGTLVSTEAEQKGLAGILQRLNTSFASHREVPVGTGVVLTEPVAPAALGGGAVSTYMQDTLPAAPAAADAVPTPVASTSKEATVKKQADEDTEETGSLLDKEITSADELRAQIKEGSIPRIVAAVVSFAINQKSSDVHLETFEDEVRVRYRIDGQLVDVIKMPHDVHAAVVSRIKILSRLRLDETRVPQDGRFDVHFNHAQVDLRVSTLPTVHGEKVVMRILEKGKGIASLDALGLEGLAYERLLKGIEKPFGICLATGPTGSGKSTSLYAILKQIATPNVNVVTLEDPVEYEMKGINQSQIRPKIGFTFAEGLRSILRQDPNIIMVGEVRDAETATMATQAALTGHLVLSTLHTNDAAGAIPRMENMGIEPFLITSSLNIAMGQRLVRRICQHCKAPISLPDSLRDKFASEVDQIRAVNPQDAKRIPQEQLFYQGMGCEYCGGKGYKGRIGIYEVLTMSPAIEQLALDRASGNAIAEAAQKEGMITMYQDGLLKVLNGQTTLDEVLRETTTA